MEEKSVRFLSLDNVIQIHANTILEEGGLSGIREMGLLKSAVAMPQTQWAGEVIHRGLADKAAAYLFHITANHAFLDGNKRTGALAALVFLDQNGINADRLPSGQDLEQVTLDVAAKRMSKEDLINWMRTVLNELVDDSGIER